MNQESIFKGLAVITATALIVFIGYSLFRVYYGASRQQHTGVGASVTLEENIALKATIDTLEAMWNDRQEYVFRVAQDPLHLARVIKDFEYARTGKYETEEEDIIRLSATVIDDNPKAIIKYGGKSYVVQAGDMIGKNYKVLKIEKMQVILDNRGKRMALVNKPRSGSGNSPEGSAYSNNSENSIYNY